MWAGITRPDLLCRQQEILFERVHVHWPETFAQFASALDIQASDSILARLQAAVAFSLCIPAIDAFDRRRLRVVLSRVTITGLGFRLRHVARGERPESRTRCKQSDHGILQIEFVFPYGNI